MKKLEGSGCGLLSGVSMQFGWRNKGNPIKLLPIQGSQWGHHSWCSPWLWPWLQVVFLNLSPFQPVHVPHPHLVMTLCCVIVVPGPQAALFVILSTFCDVLAFCFLLCFCCQLFFSFCPFMFILPRSGTTCLCRHILLRFLHTVDSWDVATSPAVMSC
jgi:hypothetical protein